MNSWESLRRLLRQSHHAGPADLPEMAMQVAPSLEATALILYLVDHQQQMLIPLLGGAAPPREPIMVDGTLAGRAFGTVATCVESDGTRAWMPLLDGAERMGVLEVTADAPLGDTALDDCAAVASLLAELVTTRSLYSDTVERVRRLQPMQIAAEMLRAQLPPLTYSAGRLIISGILEPCYDVGGDAFDYAVNGDTAHLALFDAPGHGSAHGLRAVVLASIALAGYRNARRAGLDLIATYHHIDEAVRGYDRSGLITAVLGEIDQSSGILRVISAGHPSGIVLRRGKVAAILPTPTALPVVLGDQRPPVVVEQALEPGDTVLLYTDGIIEARSPDGDQFGVERLIDFTTQALADQLPAPETTRRLVRAILAHQDNQLQDDATVLLAEWRGPAVRRAGAAPAPAPPQEPLALDG